MFRPRSKMILAVTAVFVCSGSVSLSPAFGYTLTDWMRIWPSNRAPVTVPVAAAPAVVPGTTLPPQITMPGQAPPAIPSQPAPVPGTPIPQPTYPAAPSCTGCGVPPATYGAGCGVNLGCGAAPANCGCTARSTASRSCGAGTATAVGYAPHVEYRTSWVRVPTTNYRPVTTYDPTTRAATTAMRPCTTYTWQLRQVPHWSLRPAYPGQPVSTTTTMYAPNGLAAQTCAPATTPYYSTPSGTAVSPAPQSAIGNPPSLTPSPNLAPSTGGAANVQPSLSPSEIPQFQSAPSSTPTFNYPPSSEIAPSVTAPSTSVPSSRATLRPTTPPPSSESHSTSERVKATTTEAATEAATNGSGTGSSQNERHDLKPVPDPEPHLRNDTINVPAAPGLFDAHDKTASNPAQRPVRMIWGYSPIDWPEVVPASRNVPVEIAAPEVAPLAPEKAQGSSSTRRTRHSSGWRSVEP